MKRATIIDTIKEYTQISIGVFLASIGLKAFLLPNGFLDGGATGIALLLDSMTSLDVSVLLLLVSIPFLVLGVFTTTKRILIKSIFSIVLLSLAISLETFPVITNDKLLIAIFGGLFLGAGIGLAIRNGSVLDGSELLGVFIFDRFGISIGKTILVFNVILFAITAIVLSVEIALYSILTYIVTAKVIDLVVEGFENFIGVTIVSRKATEIESALLQEMGVGATVYTGTSGYGSSGLQQQTRIIHTVVNRIDIRKIYRILNKIDPDVFVIEFDVNAVRGGVLRHYFNKKNEKKLADNIVNKNK